MKKETIELIDFIKLNLAYCDKHRPEFFHENKTEYFDKLTKAISFLDSLPEIESHLTQGGYIQDIEGVPCCAGDWVKTIGNEKFSPEKGILSWCWPSDTEQKLPQFCILSKERELFLPLVPFRKLSSSEIPNR